MRNNLVFLLAILGLFCSSCNIPAAEIKNREENREWVWNVFEYPGRSDAPAEESQSVRYSAGTPTPQLIVPVDFEEAFSHSQIIHRSDAPAAGSGNDSAQWLYFSPNEYSAEPLEVLYAAFQNNGSSTWADDYYLEFYAGNNPSKEDKIRINHTVSSGSSASFEIPIKTTDRSWKSCWQLKNSAGISFYEFCYNHGDGTNISEAKSAQNSSESSSSDGVYFAFRKTDGTAPAKFSSTEQSAEFLSISPNDGHTFKAYDHNETISVSFKNTGSESWDPSYRLVFYNGYNWFHHRSFPLQETIGSGETAVFTMPMEIIEDNDKWVTCWYLSTPDGQNLSDFCFRYYTKS